MARVSAIVAAILLLGMLSTQVESFSFSVGDFYAANISSSIITQYDTSGAIKGSLTVTLPSNGRDLRGLAFGPDGLLYATVAQSSGFSVLALDSYGTVQRTYTHTAYISGDIGYGAICFDNSGYFYVAAGGTGLVRFNTAAPSSVDIINREYGVHDVEVLPSGNILMATSQFIFELNRQGQMIRWITPSDPNHLVIGDSPSFTDIQGIEYDPASNSLFVTAIGASGYYHKLTRVNAITGVVEACAIVSGGEHMILSNDGRLIVGNASYSTRVFSTSLESLGYFAGNTFPFVTQYVPVPEPSTFIALVGGLGSLLALRRHRRK